MERRLNSVYRKPSAEPQATASITHFKNIFFIILIAFFVRIMPMLYGVDWTDFYDMQAMPIIQHLNIYSATHKIFPYSPVSMFIPAECAVLSVTFKIPFHITIKILSMLSDICIAVILYSVLLNTIGKQKAYIWALLYSLNPVSILIGAFHGNLIMISVLFSFLAYTVLIAGVKKNYRLSALLLGLAIGFRGYPILLLPVFLIKLTLTLRQRIAYFLYAIVPTALSFVPFLIIDYKAVLREVFSYSGSIDYGFVAILRAIYSLNQNKIIYGTPLNLHMPFLEWSKVAYFVVYAAILFITLRKKLITSIITVFLSFYVVYTGVSSQYFVWVLPFIFLVKDKWLPYYIAITTLALANFYWVYYPFILFGESTLPQLPLRVLLAGEVISLSALWAICLFWTISLLSRKEQPDLFL